MKPNILDLTLFFCFLSLAACQRKMHTVASVPPTDLYALLLNSQSGFDSTFARKLGADQYGMKKYVLAYLKRGPNQSQDSVTVAKLQKAHLENIGRLADMGKLVLAGPFLDKGDVRGIYIFAVESVEEARKLTETDPAIQAGRLVMELHPWYGTAVLPVVVPLHKRLEKVNVAD